MVCVRIEGISIFALPRSGRVALCTYLLGDGGLEARTHPYRTNSHLSKSTRLE